jgi:4-hydroxy-2-oxoglutarate aldolase
LSCGSIVPGHFVFSSLPCLRYNTLMKLDGIFPPLTTPFAADGSLALDHLRKNVKRYNALDLAGYVVTGSTGESVLLTRAEIEQVWAAVCEIAAPGKILIAGTGVDSTSETVDRTRMAAKLGYHAALVKTPYYYKPQMTPAAEIEHFQRVADGSPIPVLIYSVPQFTGVAMEAPAVAKLAEHPNIIGIKESSGNVQRVGEIILATPKHFQTVVGSASTFLASVTMGAIGGILGLACVLPELCLELYAASRSGDVGHARDLQHLLLIPAKKIVSELGPPGVKYAMDRVGYYGGPARRPFLLLTEEQKREVDVALAALPSGNHVAAQR